MNLSPLPIQKFFDNNGRPLTGGLLFTYEAGTTNKIATYTDASGGVTNTNPIVLDFRGEARVWIDPELTYKFTLAPADDTDPPTRPIWTVDDIRAGITFEDLTREIIGEILWPRTAAEIAAGVVPVNYWIEPVDVDRYGTNSVPGVTDMTAAFDAAFLVAKASGHDVTMGRTWPYRLNGPVNATQDAGSDQYGFNVRNIGNIAAVTNNPPTYPTILADHGGHVFDCSGAIAIHWHGVTIGTLSGGTEPQTGWFCARNSAGSSSYHEWNSCGTLGRFSVAPRYLYGIEEYDCYSDFLYNDSTTAGTSCEVITANNIASLSSTFITIATGNRSTRAGRRFGGSYINTSSNATADVFKLDEVENWYSRDAFVACPGRSIVFVDPTNNPSNYCHISGMEVENGVEPTYAICFGAAGAASTPTGWDITGSYLRADTRAIFAGANMVLDNFTINGITEAANRGIEAGTMQGSHVTIPTSIVLAVDSNNKLEGNPDNWTITASSGHWTDLRASHTWSFTTTGVTFTGAQSNIAKLYADGHQVRVNVVLAAATSIVCAAGATIDGLTWPALASNYTAITVVNVNTGAAIPGGYINGTTIVLPAINVGANVVVAISASYLRTN
jgi:hypothetical protein